MDAAVILNAIAMAQALFWAAALLSLKRGPTGANRILAALLIAISIGLGYTTLYETREILDFPHLARVATPLKLLYPPLVFLYVKAVITPNFHLKQHLWHFIPFAACVGFLTPFYAAGAAAKIAFLERSFHGVTQSEAIINGVMVVQELGYIVWTLLLLRQHRRRIRHTYSSVEKINLRWVQNLIIAFVLITPVYLYVQQGQAPIDGKLVVAGMLTVFIYVLGFMAIRQPEIFTHESRNGESAKYQKSGLSSDKAREYVVKLQQMMDQQKPHLNSDLTLQELANRLSISSNHLSQILNERLNQTFFDFVNGYRVEEAKKEMKRAESRRFTILAIAYQAGFNSKSSFNTAFKKHTGMTPSEFRDKLVEVSAD